MARLEARDQREGNQKPGKAHQVRPDADQVFALAGDEEQDREPGQRRQENDAE